jgi:hypothetical protein
MIPDDIFWNVFFYFHYFGEMSTLTILMTILLHYYDYCHYFATNINKCNDGNCNKTQIQIETL